VEACEGCRFRSLCDAGCRAMSFAYHGSLLDRDPFCWLSAGEYWLDERQEIGAVVA
jgi:MoaA/NifB/PqqE/SkfB family radical SAM enzyme